MASVHVFVHTLTRGPLLTKHLEYYAHESKGWDDASILLHTSISLTCSALDSTHHAVGQSSVRSAKKRIGYKSAQSVSKKKGMQ
jgi:hypothetical protein